MKTIFKPGKTVYGLRMFHSNAPSKMCDPKDNGLEYLYESEEQAHHQCVRLNSHSILKYASKEGCWIYTVVEAKL